MGPSLGRLVHGCRGLTIWQGEVRIVCVHTAIGVRVRLSYKQQRQNVITSSHEYQYKFNKNPFKASALSNFLSILSCVVLPV